MNTCQKCDKAACDAHQLCLSCFADMVKDLKPQTYEVYRLLIDMECISKRDAREQIGCDSLAQRIHELRKWGLKIEDKRVPNGNGGRHALYFFA